MNESVAGSGGGEDDDTVSSMSVDSYDSIDVSVTMLHIDAEYVVPLVLLLDEGYGTLRAHF